MCLGTFSRRGAVASATIYLCAECASLRSAFLFHRTQFPMKQKKAVFPEKTTLFLLQPANFCCCYPYCSGCCCMLYSGCYSAPCSARNSGCCSGRNRGWYSGYCSSQNPQSQKYGSFCYCPYHCNGLS